MAKKTALYVLRLQTALPDDPPSKPRVFKAQIIRPFRNEEPGSEFREVYGYLPDSDRETVLNSRRVSYNSKLKRR